MAVVLLLCTSLSYSDYVRLRWDANTESDLAGYKVYYGNESRVYGEPIDVGNVIEHSLEIPSGTYVAVTAYDNEIPSLESGFSNEFLYTTETEIYPATNGQLYYEEEETEAIGMPAPVFYSYSPFGTGTIETGAGNITITSGIAVLSVEQTGNIGAGVTIEYNDLIAYIAPNRIGFDSGGTVELLPDTKIEDATSGATGIVRFVELLSGSWAGGDAAGWIYFEKTTGTFGNDNIINRTKPTASDNIATVNGTIEGNIGNGNTEFVVKSAVGADAANQTETAVTSIHHEYASLSAFEAGFIDANHINDTDLTNADVVAHACWYYDHDDQTPDSTTFTLDYGTDDATRYLKVFTPTGNAESINNQRHSGVWDANKAYFITADRFSNWIGDIVQNYTKLEGLQAVGVSTDSAGGNELVEDIAGTNIIFESCIIRGGVNATYKSNRGIFLATAGGGVKLINSVFYDFTYAGVEDPRAAANAAIYHCSFCACGAAGIEENSGTFTVTNCPVFNNTDDFDGVSTITFCASDDEDGSDSQLLDSSGTPAYADEFTNAAGGDFSLPLGSICIDNATSLAASQGIWRDIAGNERGATPDIGAFEYVAAGGGDLEVNVHDCAETETCLQ